ncbi:DUF6241 domain-containing protein [Halobacillus seohaensis]|uniref:DUF6241 domain-containing protein n=1 Tax=Halobacillus seohaensis TaxID=447421 RepID=A0ABW2EMA6_9BACI
MKKIFTIAGVTLFIVCGGIYIFFDMLITGHDEGLKANQEASGKITTEEIADFENEGQNPFGMDIKQEELSGNKIRSYIHGMSHQKVEASKKWGFYQIHDERIDWLLNGLDKTDTINEDIYRDILIKWKAGDFSEVDKDHNTIWNMQGGTVGKTTGILSEEEEKEYINSKP